MPARKSTPLEVRSKVWVELGGKVALSDWRVDLLRAVDATGSLAGAAERMGVPYRTAWHKLKEIETQLGLSLLHTVRGGSAGGASRLTPDGRAVVEGFDRIQQGIQQLVQERFDAEFGKARSN